MMKRKVVGRKKEEWVCLFLVGKGMKEYYLMRVRFSKAVIEYFDRGRSVDEIMAYSRWGRNPKMDKLIMRLPAHIRSAERDWDQD